MSQSTDSDVSDTADTAPVTQAPPVARRLISGRALLLYVVPLVAGLIGLALYLHGGRVVETDNAYVKADKVPMSSEVSGMVTEVFVRENEAVAAGQRLFRLDPAPFQVAVAKAEAKLAQVRIDLAALKASYRQKQAAIALAHTRSNFAVRDQQRQADLAARNFISASKLDEAKQTSALSSQEITAEELDLNRIAQSLGGSVDAPVERHPSYLAALAELEQAKLDLSHVEVRASLPGTVSKPPKPGQHIAAGTVALALVVSGNLWVEANFTETDLTYVRPGQPATVTVDTYPGVEWKATVESLSPATGSEFSLLPAQNATGNWVKITQRVPLRISLEPAAGAPELRAGLSCIVAIDTGHRRHIFGASL